eukprot:2868607-Ditylum_brightwellii.AAC.1
MPPSSEGGDGEDIAINPSSNVVVKNPRKETYISVSDTACSLCDGNKTLNSSLNPKSKRHRY